MHFAIGGSLTAILASYILKKPTELDALGNSMPLTLSRFSMQPDGCRRAARYAAWAALFGAALCGCNQSTETSVSGSKQTSTATAPKGETAAANPDTSHLKRIIILENDEFAVLGRRSGRFAGCGKRTQAQAGRSASHAGSKRRNARAGSLKNCSSSTANPTSSESAFRPSTRTTSPSSRNCASYKRRASRS